MGFGACFDKVDFFRRIFSELRLGRFFNSSSFKGLPKSYRDHLHNFLWDDLRFFDFLIFRENFPSIDFLRISQIFPFRHETSAVDNSFLFSGWRDNQSASER